MAQATGLIEGINISEGMGARGPYKKMTLKVGGGSFGGFINDTNSDLLMSLQEGDEVQVEYTSKTTARGSFNNFSNVTVISKGGGASSSSGVQASNTSGDNKNDNYQFRSTHAGGMNRAIELVKACLNYDAVQADAKDRILALPSKKADKLEAIVGLVKALGQEFALETWDSSVEAVVGEANDYEE